MSSDASSMRFPDLYGPRFSRRDSGMRETVRVRAWPTRVAAGSAVLMLALGLTVLAGWFSHVPALIQFGPQLPPMTRNAAACSVLCGLALLMVVLRGPRWLTVVCAGIVSAVSILTIGEYVFGVNPGIDGLLGPSYVAIRVSSPGRMAPVAAICFGLGSMGLLLAPRILSKRYALLLGLNASIIAAAGMATVMSFSLGSSDAFGWGNDTRASLPTAVALWVFGFGMLALAWRVETDRAGTPRWLPISVAIGVATSTVGLWQALIADGYSPFALLPAVVLGGGCLMAPIFGLTIYLAQRAHTQAAALGRSEARKAAILDSALDCILTIDHEGRITEFNPAAERTFGYRRDEVVGKQLADVIIPPSHREQHRRGLARYLATGEARVLGRRVEMTAVRADGSEFPVELAITRIPLDGPPSFTGYLRDITEHKQAIDERKRAEIQLAGEKRLLEMVASGCSLPDVLTALCSFVEDTATECHCGVYLIDWSGPRLREVVAPSLPATFNDPLCELPVRCENGPCGRAACLKTQVIAVDVESDPLWQASPFRPLALAHGLRSCWSTPIYSLAGHVLGTFAILQRKPARPTPLQQDLIAQVTHIASIAIERAQGEAALKRSEAFLAEAQHLSSTGSFSWRVETDEVTWSDEAYRIFELDSPLTPGRIRTRVHPEDMALFDELIERARVTDNDFEYEHRLLMPDHSVKFLRVVARATRKEDGELEYIGAIQDVTETRLSEEALDKARSDLAHVARVTSLGALTASIAHEVNQPLSGIMTNASTCQRMLSGDPPNVDGARETARRTIRDANRASDVIARLRALFAKNSATTELVDLNQATREVIALSLNELQRSRVILRAELADDLPLVTGDRVQLQQVVLNLLLNASEAMSGVDDRPRQVVIRTERDEGDHVRLTVQDAGVGFEPQNVNRLFEAFYTTKSGGMGIGLSVSRSIIESHNGRFWAAPNDGPGATFSFSIPRAPVSVTGAQSLGAIRAPAVTDATHVRGNS
jgi:PAS domain S-box-containing protein